jgi:hypothetical protein
MTPDDVLEVFVESCRQDCAINGECDPEVSIHFDMTVSEWRDACDLLSNSRKLGRALNEWFETDFSDSQWRSVLRPARRRTLRQVCELIATRAQRPVITPASVLGHECLTAGAFFTIREVLRRADFDVADLRPSTALSTFLETRGGMFVSTVAKLGSMGLPTLRIFYGDATLWSTRVLGVSWLAASLAALLSTILFGADSSQAIVGWVLAIITFLGLYITCLIPPKRIELGDLRDFRDLCRVLSRAVETSQSSFHTSV